MPATAHQPDSETETMLAPVVSLDGRRGAKKNATAPAPALPAFSPDEAEEKIRQYWARVFAVAHIDMSAPETRAVVAVVTKELERLVGGLLVLREGRAPDLPSNPNAGVDPTSATEVGTILRDLTRSVEAASAERR